MDETFDSSKRKIARAKQHLLDLERQIGVFIDGCPYENFIEADPDKPDFFNHKIRLTKALPDLGSIVGDFVNNLREALDNACFGLAVASGKTDPKSAHFPFAGSETDLENSIRGNAKDVPSDIYPFFRSLKPYRGGNEVLYTLNRMCNANKHRIFRPVGMGTRRHPALSIRTEGYFSMQLNPVWDRIKNEMIYLTVRKETKGQYNFGFMLFVAFDEVDGINGEPAIPILRQTFSEIEGIVLGMEAESRRLGIIS